MRLSYLLSLLMCGFLFTPALFASEEGKLEEGMVNPGHIPHPEWFQTTFLDLQEDLQDAGAEDKRLLLYFYQDGCPYCEKLIGEHFNDPAIVDKTRSNYNVVAINIWGDLEVSDLQGEGMKEKELARRLGVQFTPTLLFLDEQGADALRLNGFLPGEQFMAALEYAAVDYQGPGDFRDYLNMRPARQASGRLHREKDYLQPPYALDLQQGDAPLLVLFEQKNCATCDELHGEAFRRLATKKWLQHFTIALVDVESADMLSTPSGERLSANQWAQRLGIHYTPSMVFFDKRGQEIFRTEAYLRPFHVQSALEYVAGGAYREQKEFQRFVQDRADKMRAQGMEVDIWE